MKKLRILNIFLILLSVICYLLNAVPAFAADWSNPSGDQPAKIQDLEIVFSKVLTIVIPLAGIAAFIMLVMGGLKYLTSGGDPKQTQSAQQTITYAVAGLIILVAAYLIINFISTFTGVPVGTFVIPK